MVSAPAIAAVPATRGLSSVPLMAICAAAAPSPFSSMAGTAAVISCSGSESARSVAESGSPRRRVKPGTMPPSVRSMGMAASASSTERPAISTSASSRIIPAP
jgi:hypothetical protein